MFQQRVLPWLIWIFYRLWSATWRVQVIESEGLQRALSQQDPLVFAHWHGIELAIVPLVRRYKIATMVSTSKDGALMDFVIRKYQGATSRGSSTRGGIGALKGLVRLMGEGFRASLAVDGPKGPIYKVKPGIMELSRLGHAQIVPLGAAASCKFVFQKSWNKAFLPLPFSKVVVVFNEPWPAITKDQSAKDAALAERLEQDIARACQSAEANLR